MSLQRSTRRLQSFIFTWMIPVEMFKVSRSCFQLFLVLLVALGGLLTFLNENYLTEKQLLKYAIRIEQLHIVGIENRARYEANSGIGQGRDLFNGLRCNSKGIPYNNNKTKQPKVAQPRIQTWTLKTTERPTEIDKLMLPSSASLKKRKLNLTTSSPTAPSKDSVYGEPGCRENPWRDDLAVLLQHWINLTTKHHIEYVLAYGCLLGAARNGDVIPYDSDIDVLIDVKYFPVMKKLAAERNFTSSVDMEVRLVLQPEFTLNISVETRKRFDCQGKETPHMMDQCSFQEPLGRLIQGNLHIDIFHFYDRVHSVDDPVDDRLKQYQKKDFYPFRPCSLMGIQTWCPNKPWEILRMYFRSDDLAPLYTCRNRTWVDRDGNKADVF